MSPRWQIAAKLSDGLYGCIYVHCDGYPEHALDVLQKHYIDQTKIDALISLGDCLGVSESLNKCETFRKRGEDWSEVRPTIASNPAQALEKHRHGDEEFAYVWDGSSWSMAESRGSGFS